MINISPENKKPQQDKTQRPLRAEVLKQHLDTCWWQSEGGQMLGNIKHIEG